MNTEETKTEHDEIPLFLKGALIFIASAINLPILFNNFNIESIFYFILFVLKNLVLVPAFFLFVGFLIRLSDDAFKLSNAYYLGVFMAIVLSVQGVGNS